MAVQNQTTNLGCQLFERRRTTTNPDPTIIPQEFKLEGVGGPSKPVLRSKLGLCSSQRNHLLLFTQDPVGNAAICDNSMEQHEQVCVGSTCPEKGVTEMVRRLNLILVGRF